MNQLEKLKHRVDLIIPKIKSTKIGNLHKKNNYIYMIYYSLKALEENKKPLVWSTWTSKKITADIKGLNKMIDDAEKYLKSLVKEM